MTASAVKPTWRKPSAATYRNCFSVSWPLYLYRSIIRFQKMPDFKQSPLAIIGRASEQSRPEHKCPLYLSPVSAGWPSPADDYIEKEINLHEIAVRNPAATFFLRASGDSMIGAGIHDGDLLVVDRSVPASHNCVVIAAVDGELLVKKICRRKNRVYLVPANPNYPEIDITDGEYLHIWGVVIYCLHKL